MWEGDFINGWEGGQIMFLWRVIKMSRRHRRSRAPHCGHHKAVGSSESELRVGMSAKSQVFGSNGSMREKHR